MRGTWGTHRLWENSLFYRGTWATRHRIDIPGAQMRGTWGTHRLWENSLFYRGTWATRPIGLKLVSRLLNQSLYDRN
jgi:hypothetical protein